MIRVLDSFVADKIAAGEVIERPVSAVKELIENSIDAGASQIIVEIRNGGKSYIRVTDDGCGIAQDEAETAFLRHATSKISGITDLDNIVSLGFRGEALASIAAVSKITLVTRTADSAAGTRLMLHGGKLISCESAGANPGTTILVEDLFYNTPARRKFMRSDAREASAIIELVQEYAICYSGIRFMMINNGSSVFSTRGDGDTLTTITDIYSDNDHSRLIGLESEAVRGYISDPGTTRSTRRGQLFFVNGRLVSSSVIEKGLEKGYGGRVFSGYPVAILFIDADPREIDVNIHPGKKEIRFLRQDEITDKIAAAVSGALESRMAVPKAAGKNVKYSMDDVGTKAQSDGAAMAAEKAQDFAKGSEQGSIRDYLRSLERPEAAAVSIAKAAAVPDSTGRNDHASGNNAAGIDAAKYDVSEKAPGAAPEAGVTENGGSAAESGSVAAAGRGTPELPEREAASKRFDFGELEYRGYVFDTYIIMQARDELYLFDQHAAHERIFYERLTDRYREAGQLPQPILTPFTINVSPDIYHKDRGWLEILGRIGYDISDFGACSFIVRGIPAYMTLAEAEAFASSFCEDDDAASDNSVVIDKLIMRSCKSAVKGGERLSAMEINDLIAKLSECSNPYACPHGRPTFIRVTRYDIERSFRRK